MASNLWRTDDMSLAAFLMVDRDDETGEAFEMLYSEWDGKSCFWYFNESPELSAAVADYFGGTALVDPRHHSVTVARLKRDMFAAR